VCYQQGKRTQKEPPKRRRTLIEPLKTLNENSVIPPSHAANAQNTRTETAPALFFSTVNFCGTSILEASHKSQHPFRNQQADGTIRKNPCRGGGWPTARASFAAGASWTLAMAD
jgi:hypothetical protein